MQRTSGPGHQQPVVKVSCVRAALRPARRRQSPPGPFISGLWPGLAAALAKADCASVTHTQFAPSSRLAGRAPRHELVPPISPFRSLNAVPSLKRLPNPDDRRPTHRATVARIDTAPTRVSMGLSGRALNIDSVDSVCRRADEPLGLCIGGVGDLNHLDLVGPLLELQGSLQILERLLPRWAPVEIQQLHEFRLRHHSVTLDCQHPGLPLLRCRLPHPRGNLRVCR